MEGIKIYNYRKLLGRIKEKNLTQDTLAKNIGMTSATLSLKLNNKSHFRQEEISKICIALDINDIDVGTYFFTHFV